MPQDVRWRRQKVIQYASNNKWVESLSRGMVYRDIFLKLQGAPTLTAANNTRAKTQVGDEWGCVKRIDIIANASDVIRSFSGEQLWWINYYMYGCRPNICTQLGDSLKQGAGTGTANPVFNSTLCIPFWSPGMVKPMDTALDSSSLSDLRIEVTWGTYTDINSSATAWTTNPTLEVSSNESYGIDGPFKLARLFQIVQNISGANSEQRIDIPVGPQYRGFLINVKETTGVTDTPWNYPTDTAGVSNFKLQSGTTVFFDLAEPVVAQIPMLRGGMNSQQWLDYNAASSTAAGVPTNIATANMTFTDHAMRVSTNSDYHAWYYINLLGDGYGTEAIDTYGFSELFFSLNVKAASVITILPFQLVPLRNAA